MSQFRDYYLLTKPGIIRGNVLVAIAAYIFGSGGDVDIMTLLGLALGTSFVIASACVCNNYIDRHIDKQMLRTKKRALAAGTISGRAALTFAFMLGLTGFAVLFTSTNWLTSAIGIVGFLTYVFAYSFSKHRTMHATLIGSIPGAMPPLAGYTAATQQLDGTAGLLFLVLVCWQMPHFYAISLFRRRDYESAHVPVLPVVRGTAATRRQIIVFIIAFIVATLSMSIFGYTGLLYTVGMIIVSGWWLKTALNDTGRTEPETWAKRVFGVSLAVLLTFSVLLSLDPWVL